MAQIGRLHVGLPQPGLARRDPKALRYAMLLAVLACLGIANTDAPSASLCCADPIGARRPGRPGDRASGLDHAAGLYPHRADFHESGQRRVSAPAGSHLTINVSGGTTAPILTLNDRSSGFNSLDRNSFQAAWDLTRGGHLTVRRDGATLAAWTLTVIADQPPMASWGENPGVAQSGQQTRLPWQVSDDYGVTNLQAELRLKDQPDAPPLVVTIPLPAGSPKASHGVSQPDLTAHVWAGLPVAGRLVARDALGQTGTSADATFEIGGRPFHNPIARLLIAARKSLSMHPKDRVRCPGSARRADAAPRTVCRRPGGVP